MGLEKNPAIRFVLQRAGRVYTAGPAADGRAKAADRNLGDLFPADGLTAAPCCVGR